MIPSFNVPAQYFYALIADLPIGVDTDVRYRMALSANSKRVVDQLRDAIDNGVISGALSITPEQAARRLAALGSATGTAPVCNPGVGSALVAPPNGWLGFANPSPTDDPAADIAPFWNKVLAPLGSMALSNPGLAQGHLQFVVCAIIQESDPAPLINAVQAEGITLDSVKNLDPQPFGGSGGLTFDQWKQIFKNHPNAIPAFAKVGVRAASPEEALYEQTSAFVRRLAQFFNLPALVASTPTPASAGLPTLERPVPNHDAIALFVTAYRAQPGHGAFEFGQSTTLDLGAARAAAALVFPSDGRAAAWLVEAASVINTLYAVADLPGVDPMLRFSIAEALYARGFYSVESITSLTADELADALVGTVAYPFAKDIQAKAGPPAPATAPAPGPFGPVNDGTLANCVPPDWLSPLGPVAYLHEMWTLPQTATCELPDGSGKDALLGDVVTTRRGPLGDLLATQANLETALPMIDLVNESLEQLVANGAVTTAYQTAGDVLAGHPLARPGAAPDDNAVPYRHDPERLFAALPEHSSPGAGLAVAYDKLKNDFSAPVLPYSQPIDVCRTNLGALGTTRFDTMRRLRKDITEYVLDPEPAHQPADFAAYRWRYPVRVEIAREYLGITPEEYSLLFTADPSPALLAQLYGYAPGTPGWMTQVARLSEFLARTGLRYCELVELWRSGFVRFEARVLGKDQRAVDLPLCEPCYPDKVALVFADPAQDLAQLAVFIRLWRKLSQVRGARYSFTELADIAAVLQLFLGKSVNPDFVRQLAAFQMLRDDFHLPLKDPRDSTPGTGADRTHLLALFAVPPAGTPLPRKWGWAIEQLIDRIGHHARTHHHAKPRPPEFIKLLARNLDPISRLCGFNPASPDRRWHAHPTHALRFAEVISKLYASRFTVGEILFLLTTDDALDGDDPFPLPTEEEALDSPLDLPDDDGPFTLWNLRARLLAVEVSDEEARSWTWPRIERSLREELGFEAAPGADPVLALGTHFFPTILERAGTTVTAASRQYRHALPAVSTSPAMWNAPVDGPFRYDSGAQELWTEVPLRDEAVLEKLSRIRQLAGAELGAVRDLYFLPRLDLAPFAFLFPTFEEADRRLAQEPDEEERWAWFQRAFALCHARCRAIAEHLGAHVAAATGEAPPEHEALAWRILRQLLADENAPKPPAPWENDAGTAPTVTWPRPSGGAFAAILGLLGTGLLGELKHEGSPTVLWRELRGPMDAFGRVRNRWNVPVPTVLPSLTASLPPAQAGLADVRNGIMIANSGVKPLGGAEGYCVHWHGVLLVDEAGPHEFFAGVPAQERRSSDAFDVQHFSGAPVTEGRVLGVVHAPGLRWRVTLRRGQKSWIVLSRDWHGDGDRSAPLSLKRGAYEISVELVRRAPDFEDADDVHPIHAGFELAYAGPDTGGRVVPLPLHRLFLADKDATLGDKLDERTGGTPKKLLDALYVSSLRDVRRTYQRAFKALLLASRFDLHARTFADYAESEIGYLIDHPDRFQGTSFYGSVGAWTTHRAIFDLDFLPVRDPYLSPSGDDRAAPSIQRRQALFDVWERLYDYTWLRRQTRARTEQPVWLLFDDAARSPDEDPTQLLRYMGINATYAPLILAYEPGYSVVTSDLRDERWPLRVWRAETWVRGIEEAFSFKDVRDTHPSLWAADDPLASGGNADLTRAVQDGCIERGAPRRYEDLKRLNDGLRERARSALVAYLCGPSGGGIARSAKELSDRLLLDVEVGLCERASRIEEGISAVQTYVRRARLGLEKPAWSPDPAFSLLWDRGFASFRVFQACKRKAVYRENWIAFGELEEARRTEGFRFLESELRRAALTVPMPGGLTYWEGARPPAHDGLEVLQAREPSTIALIPKQPEALDLLGTPERSARRSWLASIPGIATPPRPPNPDHGDPRRAGDDRLPLAVAVTQPGFPRVVTGKLPFWIEAAVRLGTRFLRVAAAGVPPASNDFAPRHLDDAAPPPRDPCNRTPSVAGCCRVCGRRHDAVIDEYYFWIVDSRYFSADDASRDPNANWDDDPGTKNADLPKLLSWTPRPAVYLMWSRMHDGELMQPRRSTLTLPVDSKRADWELVFDGRKADSLYFRVIGAAGPPAGYEATPLPGFRYDLATDSAVTVPEVTSDPPPADVVGGLDSYPYFAYFAPGAPLVPLSLFSESIAVAGTLRSHCRFEAALRWYEAFYDPLTHDSRWCWQSVPRQPPPDRSGDDNPTHGVVALPRETGAREEMVIALPPSMHRNEAGCCRFGCATDDVARRRAVTLDYVETLLDWGDALVRKSSIEAIQQARVVFDTAARILGERPRTVLDDDLPMPPPTVADLDPDRFGVPLNPRLLALYDRTADRLSSVHAYLDAERLRSGRLHEAMIYGGDDPRRLPAERRCGEDGMPQDEACGCDDDGCCLPSPYRFTFLVQKALELAGEVRSFGGNLLAAFEKGDAEHLAYVRASHERQLNELALAVREEAWRAADWEVQALKKSKELAQNQLQYYTALIAAGLNSGENDYQGLTEGAAAAFVAATVSQTIGTIMGVIPDVFVGTTSFVQLPLGTKLANVFNGIGQISSTTAQILSTTAGLRLTQSGWERRLAEWRHQADVFAIEIEQIQRQIFAAERRRASALFDLDNTRRQIEQSREVLDLLRDKLTNHQLYLYLQRETAALHRQMYGLSLRAARQAERAFNFERGHTARSFIQGEMWSDLREGLLAGERLTTALRRMEKAYCDENVREYELTKHISLRQLFPSQFQSLKDTGSCELEIPEWLFNLDYPGHYLRRIKSVSLTIPCVVGPYTGVHCRLTLLASATRVVPWLLEPIASCCKDEPPRKELPPSPCGCWSEPPRPARERRERPERGDNGYRARPDDPRIVKRYGAREAVATSSGQNDAGLFELNFRDERYLPFELEGAVSRFRIELPPENNYFDMDTLSDVVLHLNYTAREGGEVLRKAAREDAERRLPDAGRRLFDVRRELPDAFRRFEAQRSSDGIHRNLELRLGRDMFMFLPGNRDVTITGIEIFFEAPDAAPGRHWEVDFVTGHKRGCAHGERGHELDLECVASDEWPGLYRGSVDVHLGSLSFREHDLVGVLRFHEPHAKVGDIYIVCSYETRERHAKVAHSPARRLPERREP